MNASPPNAAFSQPQTGSGAALRAACDKVRPAPGHFRNRNRNHNEVPMPRRIAPAAIALLALFAVLAQGCNVPLIPGI